MKTSAILIQAMERVSEPDAFVKNRLAVTSVGFKTNPCSAEDVVAFNTVGSLLRTLSKHPEDTTPRSLRSPTQRLFASDAYSYLTDCAKALGFKTISDLDEFGSAAQRQLMWDNALTSALIAEEISDHDGL